MQTNLTTSTENSKRVRSMNRSKFVDHMQSADSSLFLDGFKPPNHEASFNDKLLEEERMQFSQNELHSASINEILRKRQNTTERTAIKQ